MINDDFRDTYRQDDYILVLNQKILLRTNDRFALDDSFHVYQYEGIRVLAYQAVWKKGEWTWENITP